MATVIWRGGAPAIAQVVTVTPANVEINDVFNILSEDDYGATQATVTFTASAATVANVTAGLTAAWNASRSPFCTGITASDSTTHVTLTADTAGIPFYIDTSTVDGGGANTQTLTAATATANSGPNAAAVAYNWSGNAVPGAGDTVHIPAGSPSLLYDLDMDGWATTEFIVDGHSGQIGRFGDYGLSAPLRYLKLDPSSVRIIGDGSLVAIDCGANACYVHVNHTGTPSSTERRAVYLLGTAFTTIEHLSGTTGIAAYANNSVGTDETATVTTSLLVTGGNVFCGSVDFTGATVRITGAASILTLYTTVPTLVVTGGATVYDESIGWTTCSITNATVYANAFTNAAATYATTNLYEGHNLITNETLTAKTFTTVNVYGSGVRKYDVDITTWTTVNYLMEAVTLTVA
jgi:hypothetical protein